MLDLISLLLSPFVSFSKWLTYEARVARKVAKQAGARGLQIHPRVLREHLHQVRFVQELSDSSARPALRASLDRFTAGSPVTSDDLFELLQLAVTSRANPVAATTADGASTRERIDALQDVVEGTDRDRALWDTRLAEMRPLRAQTAKLIYESWPRIARVLRPLLDGPSRAGLLGGWAKSAPQFLEDAPAELWGWLAELAGDVGNKAAALQFTTKAIDAGAFPLGYWEIRRRWLEAELGIAHSQPLRDVEHALVKAWTFESAGDIDAARTQLEDWRPAILSEQATRTFMLARIALNEKAYGRAIDLALPLFEETGSPAAVLIAARAMVEQQAFASSDLYASGTADAFGLLISARDSLRQWHDDTTDVVVLATTLARLLNDPARAIALTQAAPNGEATPDEAANMKVRTAWATMLAENGILDPGRALLAEEVLSASAASHLRALIAVADGDRESAVAYFTEALEATDDFDAKGRFAYRLAELGQVHPFVDQQRELGNAQFADRLTLIAEAYGNAPGGIDRLRAAAHTSAELSLALSELYGSLQKPYLQLQTLEAAAERLDDADIWLAVARLQKKTEKASAAIRSAQNALRAAPRTWGAFARTHGLLVELYSRLPDWDKATKSAENYVRLLPGDPVAVWVLITCQYYAGEFDDALGTWDTMAGRERPTHRDHVQVWIGLYQHFGQPIGTTEDLVEVAGEWAQDEEIRRLIVQLIIQGQASKGTPTPDSSADLEDAVHGDPDPAVLAERTARAALLNDYFRDFPEGGIKRLTVQLDDEGSIIDQLTEAIGERPDTTDLDERVFSAQFPLGLICLAHGSTLAEAVVSHASGVRFAFPGEAKEQDAAAAAIGQSIVVDTTALFALAVLPEPVRVALMSSFTAISASADQFRDALAGSQTVRRYGYAGPAIGRFRGAVALRTRLDDERSLDEERILALVELMRRLNREGRSGRAGSGDGEDVFSDDTWFAAAAVAGESRPLWSDDAALNRVAAHLGVLTFSTPALLAALELTGRVSAQLARTAREHLVAERYVSVPFDAQLYAAACGLRGGASMNVASVIEHLDGSAADNVLSFLLSHAASLTPDGTRLERWLSAGTRWLVRISPDASSMRANLAILTGRLAETTWMVPQTFPFIDTGLLDGLDGASGMDPLVAEVERLFRRRAANDRSAATQWIFDLIAGLNPADRPRYTAIVLRP